MGVAGDTAPRPVLNMGQSDDSDASSPALESTQTSLNGIASEGSGQSSATTPGLEPQPTTGPNKRNAVLYPLELVPRSRTDAAQDGEEEFLKNLENYIALGSLTLRPSIGGGAYLHQTCWRESSDTWLAFHDYCDLKDGHPALFARTLASPNWVRVFARKHQRNGNLATMRVYILPDDVGRRYVDRDSGQLRTYLMKLLNGLDRSPQSWEGHNQSGNLIEHYNGESSNDDSLFYLFNTIPSPVARPPSVSCPISKEAIRSVLDSDELRGLRTKLYPYQKRTVASMIKREVEPEKALDPRFQSLEGPTGQPFYYDRETGVLLSDQRTYEEARGGILGESMGLGKTLICLATVLATKGNWPDVPPEHSLGLLPTRSKVGSLMQMAAAAVGRAQVPWRAIFRDLSHEGEDHKNCLALLEDNVGSYVISPPVTRRSHRPSQMPKGKTIRLTTATLIIVPQNLLSQWKDEISLHVEEQVLEVFYLDSDKTPIPSAAKLMKYDIILMSRQRFEREMVPKGTGKARFKSRFKGGCRCSLDEDCHCSVEEHQSPLMEVHFLRIIMDEGHEFSSSGHKNSTYWALQKLCVDRKWIVSGTPANGLLGVEVGAATFETSHAMAGDHRLTQLDLLETRKKESALIQERKDLEKLGIIVAGFLQVKPWANSKEHDSASWSKYIMPYSDGQRKVRSLKTLLDSLVVRHRIEDIEADILLPPLHNRVVYLQPSWHDKLSLNLFILTLTANAVTSERVDEDYMFHTKNRRALNALINNLRQSGFYWTSFSPGDIAKTIKVSRAYLEKQPDPDSAHKETDRVLLLQAIEMGEVALESPLWRSFADLHEMGILVERFPENAQDAWSLVHRTGDGPLLIGATQLSKAQSWVNSHLYLSNPSQGLADVGSATMQKLWHGVQQQAVRMIPDHPLGDEGNDTRRDPRKKAKMRLNGAPKLTEKQTVSRPKTHPSPRKTKTAQVNKSNSGMPTGLKPALKSALKASPKEETTDPFPPDSPLARSTISGTASAKLSYLLDRVIALHQDEKILIFYEGDHIAYYIAQALDLVDVQYLIYTKTLSLDRQNAYINTFNATETFRVLLMNVHQAAHGLHIATASRVFFVNPVWQPNVEAQAIKRAHRIGQVRPVYVETLVLKDTLEDQMLQRRKGMTPQEHQKAEKSLLDDDTMSTIIKNAQFIPLAKDHIHDTDKHVAKLSAPQQLFGRVAQSDGVLNNPDADLILDTSHSKKPSRKRQVDILVSDYTPDLGVPQLGRSSADSTLRLAGEADLAESSGTADMTRKRKSDSKHAPELTGPPSSRRRRAAHTPFQTVGEASAPESSRADDVSCNRKSDSEYAPGLAASPPPRRRAANVTFRTFVTSAATESDVPASSTAYHSMSAPTAIPARQPPPATAMDDVRPSRSARRVGFDLGDSKPEPQSLFGGSASTS